MQDDDTPGAIEVAEDMKGWLAQAAQTLEDPEVMDMATLMSDYVVVPQSD